MRKRNLSTEGNEKDGPSPENLIMNGNEIQYKPQPKQINSVPMPSSAESMRKSLDKLGNSFQPTP